MSMENAYRPPFDYTLRISDPFEIKCPECSEFSPSYEWTPEDVDCETCGEHPYARCPRCGAAIDALRDEPVENRPLQDSGFGKERVG
jgi:hypothetical protein